MTADNEVADFAHEVEYAQMSRAQAQALIEWLAGVHTHPFTTSHFFLVQDTHPACTQETWGVYYTEPLVEADKTYYQGLIAGYSLAIALAVAPIEI